MKIQIKVHPNSSQEKVIIEGNRAEVWIKAKAEKGAANLATLKVLANHLKLPMANLKLISGHTSRKKVVVTK